jgi:hypothetical protein
MFNDLESSLSSTALNIFSTAEDKSGEPTKRQCFILILYQYPHEFQ